MGTGIVVEAQFVRSHANQLARSRQLLLDNLGKVASSNRANAVTLVIVSEAGLDMLQPLTILIGKKHQATVTDDDAYGVGIIAGKHDVGRDVADMYRHNYLLFVDLVERQQ